MFRLGPLRTKIMRFMTPPPDGRTAFGAAWSCPPPHRFISVDGDGQRFEFHLMAGAAGNCLRAANHHGVNGISLQGGRRVPDGWFPVAILERVTLRLQEAHRLDTLAIDEAHLSLPSDPRRPSRDLVCLQGVKLIIRDPKRLQDRARVRPELRWWRHYVRVAAC